MSDLLNLSAKPHAILVTFLWPAPTGDEFGDIVLEGDFNTARYTNWTEDLSVDGETFVTVPQLGVDIGESTGRMDDGEHRIDMPLVLDNGDDAVPLDTLTSQAAHERVEVTIEEVMPGDDTTRRILGHGLVKTARRGRLGKSAAQGVLTISTVKHRLRNRRFGMLVTDRCPWRFGDENCKVEIVRVGLEGTHVEPSAQQESGTISAMSGNLITVSGLTTTTEDLHWYLGWAQVAGLRLRIHAYSSGSTFGLARRPPASWNGATVTMTPGCAKTPERCKYWDNILNFGAIGFQMPTRYTRLDKRGPESTQ